MKPEEISNDFCMNNVFQHCLDFKHPKKMIENMNSLLKHIWEQDNSINHMHILNGCFEKIMRSFGTADA